MLLILYKLHKDLMIKKIMLNNKYHKNHYWNKLKLLVLKRKLIIEINYTIQHNTKNTL